jgi:hypothetical protein
MRFLPTSSDKAAAMSYTRSDELCDVAYEAARWVTGVRFQEPSRGGGTHGRVRILRPGGGKLAQDLLGVGRIALGEVAAGGAILAVDV